MNNFAQFTIGLAYRRIRKPRITESVLPTLPILLEYLKASSTNRDHSDMSLLDGKGSRHC